MISLTEQLSFRPSDSQPPLAPELLAHAHANDRTLVAKWRERLCAPVPIYKPSEWLEGSQGTPGIILNIEGTNNRPVPWSFVGREYLREMFDLLDDPFLQFLTFCGGTGSGKTLRDFGIYLHEMWHNPFSGLYSMPSAKGSAGATSICHQLIQTLDASANPKNYPAGVRPPFFGRMPLGSARKESLTKTHIEFDGNDIDFVGANSPNQLSNKRCRIVSAGEQDKTKEKLGRESSADYLLGERLKNMSHTLFLRGSSPSLEGYGIWKALMGEGDSSGSDCRRRFLPCPHCNPVGRRCPDASAADQQVCPTNLKGWFVLIKDAQYNTALPTKLPDGTQIPFAELRWDKEAKRKDGSWDIDRVFRSARFECPHCGGHLRDEHRLWLDKNGLWIPTRKGAFGHAGHQLSSYYPPIVRDEYGQETTASKWGGMAMKFLEELEKGNAGGYINSDLAEVNASQDKVAESVIEISTEKPRISSVLKLPMMSCDRQAKYPGFWYVARNWTISILRPARTIEEHNAILKALPGEQKTLVEKLAGSLTAPKESAIYSPHAITAHLLRTDHWPRVADWLIANGLKEKRLAEFFQVEFQTDLIRLLEFIARQKEVNLALGKQGDSEAIEIGSADSWEELDEVQRRHGIANPDVICDSAYGHLDSGEVHAECYRRCPPKGFNYYAPIQTQFGAGHKFSRTPMPGMKPFALGGWYPCKGFEEHKLWPGPDKIRLPYGQIVHDPFSGKMEQRTCYQYLFVFDAQWALSELARIRKKYEFSVAHNCQFHGSTFEQLPVTLAEYNRHMKGYYWDDKELCWQSPAKKGGAQSRRHPNHLYDCEKNMAARAVWKGIFRYQKTDGK